MCTRSKALCRFGDGTYEHHWEVDKHIYGLVDCSHNSAFSNGVYKNPLQLDVVDRYLRRMGDKTIPDEAPPSLESFYPPWVAGIDLPQSRCCGFFVSFTIKHK